MPDRLFYQVERVAGSGSRSVKRTPNDTIADEPKMFIIPTKQISKKILPVCLVIIGYYLLSGIIQDARQFTSDDVMLSDERRLVPIERSLTIPQSHNCAGNISLEPQGAAFNASKFVITGYERARNKGCTRPVCDLNSNYSRVSINENPDQPCLRLCDCVTVVLKTKHRLASTARFIESFYKYYPGTRIIVADEYYSIEEEAFTDAKWMDLYRRFPQHLLTHIKAKQGVGFGRQLSVKMVTTKYYLLVDDDFLVTNETDLMILVRTLDFTDVAIAGGAVSDKFPFDGAVRAVQRGDKAHLIFYPNVFYEHLAPVVDCFVADIIKNFFLAKRNATLAAGSWDVSRTYYEHEDFFFTMRWHALKVVHCPSVVIVHDVRDRALAADRMKHFKEWTEHLKNKWGYFSNYYCRDPQAYLSTDICPKTLLRPFA